MINLIKNLKDENIIEDCYWALTNICSEIPISSLQLIRNGIKAICESIKNN